jgi:hypothetical protein
MGMELLQTAPDTLVLNLFGVLSHAEFIKAQQAAEDVLRAQGPKRILVNAEALASFDAAGDWGDLSSQLSDHLVIKMAVVGDPQMKDLVLMFIGKGFRKFPIEFFTRDQSQGARAWLRQGERAPNL